MSTFKKIGVVLILIGFGLSLVSLKFVSNYDSRKGIIENIKDMEVVVQKQSGSFDSGILNIEVFESYKFKPKKTIPYLKTTDQDRFSLFNSKPVRISSVHINFSCCR